MPYIQLADNKNCLPSGHVSDIGLALKHVTGIRLLKDNYTRCERDKGHQQLVNLLFIQLQCSHFGTGGFHANCLHFFFLGDMESQQFQITMAINFLSRQFFMNNSDSSANFGIVESFEFIQALSCKTMYNFYYVKLVQQDALSLLSQFNFLVIWKGRQRQGKLLASLFIYHF